MIDKTQLSNPKTHYGSGKHATRSFRVQRITAMLLIPLAGFFVWFVVRLAGADRAQMLDLVRNPVIAVLLVVLIGTVVAHMRIGMNEVIEDYIDDHGLNRLAQRANIAFAVFVFAATVIAVAKILFWG